MTHTQPFIPDVRAFDTAADVAYYVLVDLCFKLPYPYSEQSAARLSASTVKHLVLEGATFGDIDRRLDLRLAEHKLI